MGAEHAFRAPWGAISGPTRPTNALAQGEISSASVDSVQAFSGSPPICFLSFCILRLDLKKDYVCVPSFS